MLKNVEKQEVFKKGKEAMVLVIYTKKMWKKSCSWNRKKKKNGTRENVLKKNDQN
jgi:hypothetical protein